MLFSVFCEKNKLIKPARREKLTRLPLFSRRYCLAYL